MSGYFLSHSTQPRVGEWLGVASNPVLPVLKNIPGYFAVATGNGPDGKTTIVVKQNQPEAAVYRLNVGKVDSGLAKRVLHVDAGFVYSNAGAPEQQPRDAGNKNESEYNGEADFRSHQIYRDCSKREEPNQKRSDLVRRRAKLFRRHSVILTDKTEVRA